MVRREGIIIDLATQVRLNLYARIKELAKEIEANGALCNVDTCGYGAPSQRSTDKGTKTS